MLKPLTIDYNRGIVSDIIIHLNLGTGIFVRFVEDIVYFVRKRFWIIFREVNPDGSLIWHYVFMSYKDSLMFYMFPSQQDL